MGKEYTRKIEIINAMTPYGNILLYDNMEDLLKWTGEGEGADWAATRAQNQVFNGNYSLDLITKATNPAANDWVSAYRLFPPRFDCGFSVQGIGCLRTPANTLDATFSLIFDNGITQLRAGFQIDPVNSKIKYLSAANTYLDIPNPDFIVYNDYWFYFKLNVNFKNKEYINLTINHVEHDLANIAIYELATATYNTGRIDVGLSATNNQRPQMCIDDILISEL